MSQLADLKVDGHTDYEHSTSIAEFQSCIAGVLEDQLVDKIRSSGKFSLMFDESTDVSVHQNMIMYVRVLEADVLGYTTPGTYFFGIDSLFKANAESIFDKVTEMLQVKGISLSNLCGVSTDGAAVMLGHKSGVVTRLKSEVPGVLATHCIAHRLALSCCTGADAIPYMVKMQEILNSVYKFFHYSPKNMATLEAVQSLYPGQSSRFKQVFHTRWLSFEGSVSAMVSNYSSLISVFLEEKSGKALSLHKSLTCFKFLYVVHFLCDVLKPLAILSKMYQKQDLDFTEVTPLLRSTIDCVNDFRVEKNGQMLTKFLSQVSAEPQVDVDGLVTFQFQGHTIRDSSKQRDEAVKVCDQFVTGVVKSLNVRFSDNEDCSILTALSNFFNPGVSKTTKGADIDLVNEYLATVGVEGKRDELSCFLNFAHASHDNGNKSVVSSRDMANLALRHKDVYPAASEAAGRLLVAPVSTVECERGFSKQNIIKTSLRNSLGMAGLNNLMRISVDGPGLVNFNFSSAFKKWKSMKARRILK